MTLVLEYRWVDGPVYREPSTWESRVRAELGAGHRDRAHDLFHRPKSQYATEPLFSAGTAGRAGMAFSYVDSISEWCVTASVELWLLVRLSCKGRYFCCMAPAHIGSFIFAFLVHNLTFSLPY